MNVLDILRFGQADIDRLIDRLEPDDWSAIALGEWTTKDLVGHLGAFEVRFREALVAELGDREPLPILTASRATFNDEQAAVRRDWTPGAVVAELRDAHREVMDLAERVPAERWREVGSVPWYGAEYSLDDLVVYTIYGHKREHAPQLDAVLQPSVA